MNSYVKDMVEGRLRDLDEMENPSTRDKTQVSVRIADMQVFVLDRIAEKLKETRTAIAAELLNSAIMDAGAILFTQEEKDQIVTDFIKSGQK